MAWIIGIVILSCLLIIFLINQQFARAVNEITSAVIQLEKGNYNIKLDIKASSELKKLAISINHLCKYLNQNKLTTETEIQKRIGQITKMNQFMVNRELKMIELKKEISQLKKHKPT